MVVLILRCVAQSRLSVVLGIKVGRDELSVYVELINRGQHVSRGLALLVVKLGVVRRKTIFLLNLFGIFARVHNHVEVFACCELSARANLNLARVGTQPIF